VLHGPSAFLAERMLEMNKQKQQEIKGFLDWLEDEVGGQTRASSREDDQTDRLIDKVVYELYGLTEEEIKIVDGT